MPDFERILAPNPFAGDDGSIQPAVKDALSKPVGERTESLVSALDRVIMAVMPHAHPGILPPEETEVPVDPDSGAVPEEADAVPRGMAGIAPHQPAAADPLECPDEDLVRVPFPGGREAFPVFTSAQALAEWDPEARPVPVAIKNVAVAALKRGSGLITVNAESPSQMWLGRSAVAALASGTEWTAPWNDPEITARIDASIDGDLPGYAGVSIEPGERGVATVLVHVTGKADREQVIAVVQTVAAILGSEEYVKARLDVVEIRPTAASRL